MRRIFVLTTMVIGLAIGGLFAYKATHHTAQPLRATTTASAPVAMSPLIRGRMAFVTPLGIGYVYQNMLDRGIGYTDKNGSRDISRSIDLAKTEGLGRAAVVGIFEHPEGAIVVTNKRIYMIKPDLSVHQYTFTSDLTYRSAALPPQGSLLYLLGADGKQVYKYDLSKRSTGPRKFYLAQLESSRIAVGNDKLLMYYDAVPSNQSSVLSDYGRKRQVDPLIVNTANAEPSQTITKFKAVAYASLSPDGTHAAIHQKFASDMTIVDLLDDNKSVTIPAYTTTATWAKDSLLVARGASLTGYSLNGTIMKFPDAAGAITAISTPAKSPIIVTTNIGITMLANPTSSPPVAQLPDLPPFDGVQYVLETSTRESD